jgi:hypothetical protein
MLVDTSPLVRRIGLSFSTFVQRIGRWFSTSVQHMALGISILAFIISGGSLVVSSWQYSAVTRHYRLSVRPHVNVIFYLEGGRSERNGIYIANPGLGPAIIKALSVEVGGKSYSAADNRPWPNVFRDLTLAPGCFRQTWVQPGSVLKSGEEIALLTTTHANTAIVDGRLCQIELLKFLKAEGLKVRIQYESMYGEPRETIDESPVDSGMISEISTAMMQQLAPKLVEQLQSMLAQFKQLGDQMQQANVAATKRMADLWGLILLQELYEDPPGAPRGWWLQKRDHPINPQD